MNLRRMVQNVKKCSIMIKKTVVRKKKVKRTDLNVANLGESKTNCIASNKFDLPLPFLPTTQLVVEANG